jgi:hypothetical protein
MKCGASVPSAILDGEILLMMPHHRDQHLLRQVQVLLVKRAQDRGREFGDVDQRMEQARGRFHPQTFACPATRDARLDLLAAILGAIRMTPLARS